jgi:hypothetical protein
MPLIRQSIPALYGGVSQQSAVLRSANQLEAAENCYLTVANGISKRPPLEAIASLTASTAAVTPFYAWITLAGVRYLLELPGTGGYALYRITDGNKISATNDSGQDYLTTDNPKTDFRVMVVNDVIYVMNKSIVVAPGPANSDGTLTGTAQTLQSTTLDSAASGAIYKIYGDELNKFDTYYAKKVGDSWVEWIEPGIPYQLMPSTMPHNITVDTSGSSPVANFTVATWADMTVGDSKSNKMPSFVGKTLDAMTFAHDRLGFLAGSNAIWSETGKYTNFFRTTVTDVLDSDRIDVTVAGDTSIHLRWAKPIHKSVVLFSDVRQFSMDAAPIFSPKSINLTQATAFPVSVDCEPTSAGSSVYFPTNAGNYTQLRELFTEDVSVRLDAADVSSHVHRYVPKDVDFMAANTNFDIIALHSPGDQSSLYVYQFYWQGDQKVQSAWSRWTFTGGVNVVALYSWDHYFYVVYALGSTRFLGRVNLKLGDPGIADGFDYPVHLDHVVKLTSTYNATDNATYFNFPFPCALALSNLTLVKGDGFSDKGSILRSTGPILFTSQNGGYRLKLPGSLGAGTVFLGLDYTQSFTFSEQFYEVNRTAGLNVELRLRNMAISFVDTGYFTVTTQVRGHDENTQEIVPGLIGTYTSRTVGDAFFLLNQPQLATAKHRFPILAKSSDVTITVSNDSYLPANFQTAEWEAIATTRTRN